MLKTGRILLLLSSTVLVAVAFTACSDEPAVETTPGDAATSAVEAPPNVVVIMIDTLRPDALGFKGYENAHTPFLDSIAGDFAVMDFAYSTSSWTAPACASLFTGHYPPAHGVTEGFFAYQRRVEKADNQGRVLTIEEKKRREGKITLNRFADDMKLMPEYFKEAGYRTFGIATNLNIGPEIGFDRGFDKFTCIDDGTAPVVAETLAEWAPAIRQSNDGKPYFLYLHYMDVHKPYHERAPWYEKSEDEMQDIRNRYDSELAYLDGHLKTLFEEWGWGDETLMVLASDHGEEFGEHGQQGHRYGPIYRETNQILTMFRGPGIVPQKATEVVAIHDILPTLMDAAHIGAPDEGSGLSLMPLLGDAAPSKDKFWKERAVFAHRSRSRPTLAHVWASNYKNFRFMQEAGVTWFFDVVLDPLELNNIQSKKPRTSQTVRQLLKEHRALGFGNRAQPVEVEIDEHAAAILGQLGYSDQASSDE